MGVSLIPAPWTGSLYTRKPPKQETEKIDKSHVSPPGKTVEDGGITNASRRRHCRRLRSARWEGDQWWVVLACTCSHHDRPSYTSVSSVHPRVTKCLTLKLVKP